MVNRFNLKLLDQEEEIRYGLQCVNNLVAYTSCAENVDIENCDSQIDDLEEVLCETFCKVKEDRQRAKKPKKVDSSPCVAGVKRQTCYHTGTPGSHNQKLCSSALRTILYE